MNEPFPFILIPLDSIQTHRDPFSGIAYHVGSFFLEKDLEESKVMFYVHRDYPITKIDDTWLLMLDRDYVRNCNRRSEMCDKTSQYLSRKGINPGITLSLRRAIENILFLREIVAIAEPEFLTWTCNAIF